MNRFDLNLKNIRHTYQELKEKGAEELLISLKYHFLKTLEQYYDPENLKPELLNDKKFFDPFYADDKKHRHGSRDGFSQPIPLLNQQRFYYVPVEQKVYDLNQDIVVQPNYQFYNWFFAVKIAQTPPRTLDGFLDYHFNENYQNELIRFAKDLRKTINDFSLKKVDSELEVFHRFQNPINLFGYLERDALHIEKSFEIWLEYKKETETQRAENKQNHIISSNREDKLAMYTRFIKELANTPKVKYVGELFPKKVEPFIDLYKECWNYSGKVDWPLRSTWMLFEYIHLFINKFNLNVKGDLIQEFILKKFTHKSKKINKKNFQMTVSRYRKAKNYPVFEDKVDEILHKVLP